MRRKESKINSPCSRNGTGNSNNAEMENKKKTTTWKPIHKCQASLNLLRGLEEKGGVVMEKGRPLFVEEPQMRKGTKEEVRRIESLH